MRKMAMVAVLALLVPVTLSAQGGRPRAVQADAAQRAELEARILERFIDQTATQLELTAGQAAELRTLFTRNMERRREFARASIEVRRRLMTAVRAPATTDEEFDGLLGELAELRGRDQEMWQREQEALAALLSARQRAQFMARWLMLQDNIRDALARRRPPGPLR
jgi:Spy/CpxP family protein refolding chaperone